MTRRIVTLRVSPSPRLRVRQFLESRPSTHRRITPPQVGREVLESSSPGLQPGATPSQLPARGPSSHHHPTKKPAVVVTPGFEESWQRSSAESHKRRGSGDSVPAGFSTEPAPQGKAVCCFVVLDRMISISVVFFAAKQSPGSMLVVCRPCLTHASSNGFAKIRELVRTRTRCATDLNYS